MEKEREKSNFIELLLIEMGLGDRDPRKPN